jgi:hydroxymethylbilane synthase
VPIGAHATVDGDEIFLEGMVADLAGRRMVRRELRGSIGDAKALGKQLAENILEAGGDEILAEFYERD